MGRSGTGKSTIAKELEKLGYERVITYTTRPPRPGEKDGIDYHFISEEKFQSMVDDNQFGETDSFETEQGVWRYGSVRDDYKMNSVIILTPNGCNKIKLLVPVIPMIEVLLMSSPKNIVNRLKKRGDSEIRIKNRMEQDEYDFSEFEQKTPFDMKQITLWTDNSSPNECAKGIDEYYRILQNARELPNLCGFRDIVYVSHAYQNKPENLERIQSIIKLLTKIFPHNLFISPVNAFGFLYDTTSYDQGMQMCLWMLEQCTEMWVFDDYEDSEGVKREINYCNDHYIPIKYFNPEVNVIKHD